MIVEPPIKVSAAAAARGSAGQKKKPAVCASVPGRNAVRIRPIWFGAAAIILAVFGHDVQAAAPWLALAKFASLAWAAAVGWVITWPRLDEREKEARKFSWFVGSTAAILLTAPIMLLCMARPELLERRPSWGGGKWNATTVLLEPLDAAETEVLLAELGWVSDELRERIVQVAEGNPLFLEESVRTLVETAVLAGRQGAYRATKSISDLQLPETLESLRHCPQYGRRHADGEPGCAAHRGGGNAGGPA